MTWREGERASLCRDWYLIKCFFRYTPNVICICLTSTEEVKKEGMKIYLDKDKE